MVFGVAVFCWIVTRSFVYKAHFVGIIFGLARHLICLFGCHCTNSIVISLRFRIRPSLTPGLMTEIPNRQMLFPQMHSDAQIMSQKHTLTNAVIPTIHQTFSHSSMKYNIQVS
ncbi:hypothetical protein V1517DRAFT_87952 [Lipomyces orientalis]|uniref:Uncharacterized protein n=1 Tax=Lipomyces orientalis TaxID=1233043 RepID=A0ACC3TD21_9ASCO